jgi:hypothetical protein
MVQAYDHRAASIVLNKGNRYREAMPVPTTIVQHADAAWLNGPQFWIDSWEIASAPRLSAMLAFKDITSPTNTRTMIASMIPRAAAGHTLPLLLPDLESGNVGARQDRTKEIVERCKLYMQWAPIVLANLNSIPLDYVARQKVQGNHLTLYLVEQLPFVSREALAQRFGSTTADDIIRDHVLRLTYTAHDMADFAADLGHIGPPFAWDEEERLHLRARLDALFFMLYGLDRDAATYILSTFPVVRQEEEGRYQGRFRSRDLILGYMAAFAAGDVSIRIAG